jgi:hypothetical protein
VVVHENEYSDYKKNLSSLANIIVFDENYKKNYPLEPWEAPWNVKNVGPGAERNFVWDLAKAEKSVWHWVLDDNINGFEYVDTHDGYNNTDGFNVITHFRKGDFKNTFQVVENNSIIWQNIGMSCMQSIRVPIHVGKTKRPYILNTRCFSACFIRNNAPFRWRCRYNEDLILSLDMILNGWNTICFQTIIAKKMATQMMHGGNTEDMYGDGREKGTYFSSTRDKTECACRVYPKYVRPVERYGRIHHYVNFRQFANRKLVPDYEVIKAMKAEKKEPADAL